MEFEMFAPVHEPYLHKDDLFWHIAEKEPEQITDVKPPVFLVRQYQKSDLNLEIKDGNFVSTYSYFCRPREASQKNSHTLFLLTFL